MVVSGKIYLETYHLKVQYFTISTLGRKQVYGKKCLILYGKPLGFLIKKNKQPTIFIADSQAVKNSGSARDSGFCLYKCTNGIKRHLLTDVLGCPPMIGITTANISDDQGLINIIIEYIQYFKNKKVNTKKFTFLLDNGYHPRKIFEELEKVYSAIKTKIRIKITPKPTPDSKNPGFKPVHKRWIVEQANSMIDKCRVLWKNCERYLNTSKAKVQLCFIRVMLLRLTKV
jgi:hypothetical protein